MKHALLIPYSTLAIWVTLSMVAIPMASAMGVHPSHLNPNGYTQVYKQSSYGSMHLGSQFADDGRLQEALPYFQHAVEENPSSVLAQYNLGYSLMQAAEEQTSEAKKQAYLNQAEWAFRRVRDINPELTLSYFKLGKLALLRNDYEGARDYYKAGVDNHPDSATLHFNLAAAHEKLDDYYHAERHYLAAIRHNPKLVYAHNNLGLLYEKLNLPDRAEHVYKQALKEVPEYNFARLNLGSLLQAQGRLDEAQVLYEQAANIEPENPWAFLYLGNTYYRKGNYASALDAYERVIEIHPNYPTTYYLRSLVLHKLNRNEEALNNGLQYINMAPNGAFSQEANDLIMTLQLVQKRALSGSSK